MRSNSIFLSTLLLFSVSTFASDSSEKLSSKSFGHPSCKAEAREKERERENKEIVQKIYTDAINKNKIEVVNRVFDRHVVIHQATASSGVTGEMSYLLALKNNNPNAIATIKHIASNGNYVAVHWHLSNSPLNEFSGKALVDLYRLDDKKIVEHWNLSSNLFSPTASGNSLFSDLYQYPGIKLRVTEAKEEANRELVVSFYLSLFNDKNLDLIDKYVAPDYLQHNPYVPNGREALRNFVTWGNTGGLSFFYTMADDDLVWTFKGDSLLTLVDIFRVSDQTIVEHYDLF